MAVLVVAEDADVSADLVVVALRKLDVDILRADLADFPQRMAVSGRCVGGRWSGELSARGRRVSLTEITGVYYRRPTTFVFPDELSPEAQEFCYEEAACGLGGLLTALYCTWMNDPGKEADASYKPRQLSIAYECGMTTPRTLVSNDPARVAAFAAETVNVVCKSFTPAVVSRGGDKLYVPHTSLLTPEMLGDLTSVSTTMHLFQELVPRRYDVRLTAVGESCFAAALHLRSSKKTLDWRAQMDAIDYEIVDVPDAIRKGVSEYLRRFGLTFGAFDFIVTPDDEWVFLECNPAGQWSWIWHETQLPIPDAIATELS